MADSLEGSVNAGLQVYVQGADIDFTGLLQKSETPKHQVGLPLEEYESVNGTQCYNDTSLNAGYQYLIDGYLELGCSKEGDVVNGNE